MTLADTFLALSQSSDPDSPHYGDQTAPYSRKEWVRFTNCEDEISTAQIGETLQLEK